MNSKKSEQYHSTESSVEGSNGPDYLSLDDLYQSSNLGEPHPSGFLCCDIAQNSQHAHSVYYLSNNNHLEQSNKSESGRGGCLCVL